ncbi:MAG: methyltransferase [Asgard group archaeon]|nr:methyltransferase [Asgard group archaeon]
MTEKDLQKDLLHFLNQLNKVKSVSKANLMLKDVCNVNYDFKTLDNLHNFCEFAKDYDNNITLSSNGSKEWGDVQTPYEFVDKIYNLLKVWNVNPELIIEPTMGSGNFLLLGRKHYPNSSYFYGVEIQEGYIWEFLTKLLISVLQNNNTKSNLIIDIHNDDIFSHEFPFDTNNFQEILIIGNPPWITIADLTKYQSKNIPSKNNTKDLSGLDALTGKSNFDITETIIIKLLNHFKNFKGKIALLCKDTVIRNIMKSQPKESYPITNIKAIKFDSKKIFQKVCNASLFVADISKEKQDVMCSVSHFDDPKKVTHRFGWINKKFVSNIDLYKKYQHLDDLFPLSWRQGVKHDCSKVLELTEDENNIRNKQKQIVTVENDVIYPLLKGSDLRKYYVNTSTKKIILTQKKITENTSEIEHKYPKLWEYLVENKEHFQKRKSKIYKNDLFSMFGIGDYTFSSYKIAIAGLYKEPLFSLIPPIDNKPVILDDTCYFIGFETLEEAVVMTFILNSQVVYDFLNTIVFRESKRPYTKEVLMRLNLKEIATSIELKDFPEIEKRLNLPSQFNLDFTKLCSSIRDIIEK